MTPGKASMGTATPRPFRAWRPSDTSQICRNGFREVRLGQEPAAGTDGRPAEGRPRAHLQDLHDEHVAGPGALDAHGASQRMAAERATAQEHQALVDDGE